VDRLAALAQAHERGSSIAWIGYSLHVSALLRLVDKADDFYETVKQVETASQHVYAGGFRTHEGVVVARRRRHHFWRLGRLRARLGAGRPAPGLGRRALSRGHGTIEPLAMGMSGDLAYLVCLEKGEVRVVGRDEMSPMALRVTHIFRREEGVWKIIHQHADAIMEKVEATAVLQ